MEYRWGGILKLCRRQRCGLLPVASLASFTNVTVVFCPAVTVGLMLMDLKAWLVLKTVAAARQRLERCIFEKSITSSKGSNERTRKRKSDNEGREHEP